MAKAVEHNSNPKYLNNKEREILATREITRLTARYRKVVLQKDLLMSGLQMIENLSASTSKVSLDRMLIKV